MFVKYAVLEVFAVTIVELLMSYEYKSNYQT
jgi:hypothetical protein